MNRYVYGACAALVIVFSTYIIRFWGYLDFEISEKQDVWGQFGDFIGGTLNPILSFITIFLLIKSLNLQNEENISLTEQLKNERKFEKFRAYESFFFNMLDNQKKSFERFSVIDGDTKIRPYALYGAPAVSFLEDKIHSLREEKIPNDDIVAMIRSLDDGEMFYSAARLFYVIVKNIDDKLSDGNGFSKAERTEQYNNLINFTDFANLRLLLICLQFFEYPSVVYLNSHNDLMKVFDELSLARNKY